MRRASSLLLIMGLSLAFEQGLTAGQKLDDLVAGPPVRISTGHTFTEGPAWHPDGYLLFSDIPEFKVHKVAADGEVSVWWDNSGGTNGIYCTADGVTYCCQNRIGKLAKVVDQPDMAVVLADDYKGTALNSPNDLAIDPDGGLYFTDPVYGRKNPPQSVQGVYYISGDGELSRVIDDLPRPNGILVSNDGRRLIVANPNEREIVQYRITGPGQLSEGEVIFTGDETLDGNGPDGMCFDQRGNLYATYKTTVVLSDAGDVVGRIETEKKPSNCTFGGADGKSLYITARSDVYSVPMKVEGQPLRAKGPHGPRIAQRSVKTWFVQAEATEAKGREVVLRDLKLTIPGDWTDTPSASRMRLGTFRVPAADGDDLPVDYVVFPPMGGSVQQNVERWVGQFAPGGRAAKITKGMSDSGEYVLADVTGTFNMPVGPPIMRKTQQVDDARMLAAIVTVPGGGSYYLKMAGPKATVDAAADAFRSTFGADKDKEEELEF